MDNFFENRKVHMVMAILAALIIAILIIALFRGAPDSDAKEIKNITLEQKGLNIEVRWNPVECDHYVITVKKGLFDSQTRKIESSGFRIRNIEAEREYKIKVVAVYEDEKESSAVYGSIETKKLKQEIATDVETLQGFSGDSAAITAEGKGELTYAIKNDKIAAVDSKGNVTFKKTGTTTLVVNAVGNDFYKPGRKKIDIGVIPDKLPKVQDVTGENVSDSRATISWKKSDFATEYHLVKQNAATKEYEDITTVTGEKTSVEITRDNGLYAVKPFAEIGDKTASGELSEPVEIKGTAEEAETYSSGRNIMNLDDSNLELLRVINGDGETRIPQSMSLTDDCYVVSYVNQTGSSGKLISYRKSDMECVDITPCSGMGHANGITYDPNKNRFYVVKTHKSIRTASCSTYDGSTKASSGTFNLPRVTSGIAYDVSNNKYYLSKGNEIYVCDSDFKVEKFIHKFVRYNHAQDIGAYNGVALVCTWVSGSTSYIDMYRTTDGKYLGSYDVSIGEIESCVVDDGYLVILMNTLGSSRDRIYRTKERIAIP